jgi:ribokinase
MNNEFDVICVGSALLDVYMKSDKFVKVSSEKFDEGVALCEVYGGKTEVVEAEVTSGGGGTNNAVSFARKGFKTALISEMGTDLVATTIKEELVREGVDTSMLVCEEDEKTGISTIMVSSEGGRSVAVHRGASKMLTKEDIDWDRLRPKWLHISSLGGEMALLEGLIGHAKAKGIRLSVNPGKSEIEKINDWGGMSLFNGVDVLFLNREEAGMLSDMDLANDNNWSNFSMSGPKYTIITDGTHAGKVCDQEACDFFEVNQVNMVEQTGAGDAFGTGVVTALLLDKSMEEAIKWGKRQAASVVSYMGPKKGLLTLEQLQNE